MTVSSVPIRLTDLLGSVAMILLSFGCIRLVHRVKKGDPQNLVWTYLQWVCFGLAVFAVSRSAGHIIKQVLFITGEHAAWNALRPVSGAVNTFMLTTVSVVTLFFDRNWTIHQGVLADRRKIADAHEELVFLNRNLEQRVAERTAALTESERKYRRIFEVSKDMILVADEKGTVIAINPEGVRTLCGDAGEDGPQNPSISAYFESPVHWARIFGELLEKGAVQNVECTLLKADGERFRSLVSAGIDRGSEGAATIHLLVKDIEKRRRMEQQMAHADRLVSIGQLSAGFAHEINNPLGVILGYTQLLLRETDPDSSFRQDLQIIEKHVKNCKSIVEGLLNFARSSRPEEAEVDIHGLIDEVLELLGRRIDSKAVEVARRFDSSVPGLLVDEKKIRQVLINLIMNAEHAIEGTGRITVTTKLEADAGRVAVTVADTGHGIDEKDRSRIFDPFYTTKPTGEGTGLGLSVSYGIIRSHGGDLNVESRPGEGSAFTLRLPLKTGQNPEIGAIEE